MDKMCQKLETKDLNTTTSKAIGAENPKRCESPVFKCVNHTKSVRGNHLDGSNKVIHNYDIDQSTKKKTCNKHKNGVTECNSILSSSPIFCPTPTVPFQDPSAHSLGTIAKHIDKTCQNTLNKFSSNNRVDSCKPCGIFESLGMTDKDISWVSSMASPPPKRVLRSEYNTVEKATFFPEEKFQCIQPRALFSPATDDDFDCQPIIFTSESDNDDNDDKEYKSNIRLSDVCATLKQLEVESFDQPSDNTAKKIVTKEDLLISPVINTGKKKKLEIVRKKKKGILIMSPEDKCKFSVNEKLKVVDCDKVKQSDGTNFIEDDSFQSMSFSCIDELCKTLVSEEANSSTVSKSNSCNQTLVNDINIHFKSNTTLKKFYSTKIAAEIYAVSTVDNLHSYAIALEEGDKYIPSGSKIDELFIDKGIVRFDIFNKDFPKTDTAKPLLVEDTRKKDEYNEKKFKKADNETSDWEKAKQYLSESQLNVSDGEIFRTVENLEKTLASQESKDMERLITEDSLDGNSQKEISEYNYDLSEASKIKICNVKNSSQSTAFTTASGSKISVSKTALLRAQEILQDCIENSEHFDSKKLMDDLNGSDEPLQSSKTKAEVDNDTERIFMKGFLTASGKRIKISTEALEKVKTFMLECEKSEEISENSSQKIQMQYDESKKEFQKSLRGRYSADSKTQIRTLSDEASKEADSITSICDNDEEQSHNVTNLMESFSTESDKKIEVSARDFEKDKAFMVDCNNEKDGVWMKGILNRPIQDSAQSVEKVKTFMSECGEDFKENPSSTSWQNQNLIRVMDDQSKNSNKALTFLQGFSTGSGNAIQVSFEALKKAKNFMNNCELELSENPDELVSKWIRELSTQAFNTCKESKAKANICDNNDGKLQIKQEDLRNSLTSFSTALGHKEKVSSQALAKAKAFWFKSGEISSEISESLVETFSQVNPCFMSFETAGGSKITKTGAALAKAEEKRTQWNQNNSEVSGNFDFITGSVKTPVEYFPEILNIKNYPNKPLVVSGIDESDDWDEIIPSWLQVYSTSPSMFSDRAEVSTLASENDKKSLKSEREYTVKSPVLGSRDRFYGKKKRQKFQFEEDKKFDGKNQSGFVVPYKDVARKIGLKRTLNLSLDFSAPFKKMKFVKEVKEIDSDIKAQRGLAREEQNKIIKDKQKVKPIKGSYLSRKSSERQMSWMEAVSGSSPEVNTNEFLRKFGILEDILQINVKNAASFRFNGEHFFGSECQKNVKGILVGDECLIILDDENNFGLEEVRRAFLASPGVQPNLVPHKWVENHYKWIVWKLAHYERSFPRYFGGNCLTPNEVLLQLKYRYDREIDRNERSALKKILERDDVSFKRLVLCVCGIKKVAEGYDLNLTDGWYSCPARSDPAMTKLIEEGKLSVGTKLVTQGAILVNCEQGASPLEICDDVYLKISTNSTRRTKWDTKLGFQKNPENFPVSLSSILPQGGPISRIDIIIVRLYPILYMEKTLDGHHVTRNRRSEEKADAEYRRIQEKRIEVIVDEIQSEMRKCANSESRVKNSNLNSFEQEDLYQMMETVSDPLTLQHLMSADQRNIPEKFQSNQNDHFSLEMAVKVEKKLEKEKLSKRNVSEFLKAKVVDFRKPDFNNTALLSVWNPNEDVIALLSEGNIISVMNVTISNSSRMCKPLQINTTRQTQFRQIFKNVKYPSRNLTKLKDVSSKVCPAFEEVDLVGMIALIQDISYGSRLSQIVYLTDLEMNFIGIVFWGSCKDYGWENVLKIPSIVACSNLQWKKNSRQTIPSLYVNENSIFTENPKQDYLKKEMERLKQIIPQNLPHFLLECEEHIAEKIEESKWSSNISKNSSNDFTLKETHLTKSRGINGFESKPTASSTPLKPFVVNLSSEAEPSPIQKRIEKLQSYGEPPSLIPLIVNNKANKKYKN